MDATGEIAGKLTRGIEQANEENWDDACFMANETVALIQAARAAAGKDVFAAENTLARLILANSQMTQENVQDAAELFMGITIPSEDEENRFKLSWSSFAIKAGIAVFASPKTTRDDIIITLTDSQKSCCREHFDSDPFPIFRRLGKRFRECEFREALAIFDQLAADIHVNTLISENMLKQSKKRFRDLCVSEMTHCFQIIPMGTLMNEFNLTESELLTCLEELITAPESKLRDYRVDMMKRQITRYDQESLLHSAAEEVSSAMQNLLLLHYRKCAMQINMRVDH
jgi:hypothetical protein